MNVHALRAVVTDLRDKAAARARAALGVVVDDLDRALALGDASRYITHWADTFGDHTP